MNSRSRFKPGGGQGQQSIGSPAVLFTPRSDFLNRGSGLFLISYLVLCFRSLLKSTLTLYF